MNSIGFFEIQSSEPKREIQFYSMLFAWNFIRENHVPIEYYRIETGNIHGGLLKRPQPVPLDNFGTNAFTCSVQVNNFDQMASLILSLGAKIHIPKFAIPGRCWQGYFLDLDNNSFGIFEVDPNAN